MKKLDKITDNTNCIPDFVLANRRALAILKLRDLILTCGYNETKLMISEIIINLYGIDCYLLF